MSINKESHLQHIQSSLKELKELSVRTSEPSAKAFGYLGTVIDNTCGLLTAPMNSLNSECCKIIYSDDKNWLSLMQAVHRSFFASIIIAVEAALSEEYRTVPIQNKQEVEALINDLSDKLSKKQMKILKNLIPKKPGFNDYLENVLKQNNTMLEDRKKIWRKYFRCLTTLRNKASHSDPILTDTERKHLLENGFETVVNGHQLQLNTRIYAQVCNHIVQFFQELGYFIKP